MITNQIYHKERKERVQKELLELLTSEELEILRFKMKRGVHIPTAIEIEKMKLRREINDSILNRGYSLRDVARISERSTNSVYQDYKRV